MSGLLSGMIKMITPEAQRFGDKVSQMMKVSSRGLVGSDLDQFVKRAGHQFADAMRHLSLKPGEVPIHMLAIGATEMYGPNRNGDGFKTAACSKYHTTFVKHARWFRNHQNKDPRKSYGIVKLSTFNERMKRIELLVALNGTQEAADRNGGLVADRELEKLARGDDSWGVSMACRVPVDFCSGCGHSARNRSEYCTEDTCKYGGLANNITKVAADGHVLHADNRDPTFFDISDVHRPADRIAWVLGHAKVASGSPRSGAELAELAGVGMPYSLMTLGMAPEVASAIKIAHELAEIEQRIHKEPMSVHTHLSRAFEPTLQPRVEGISQFAKSASSREQALASLDEKKVCLPISDFLCLWLGETSEKVASLAARVSRFLPGVYGRMVGAADDLEQVISSGLSSSYNRERCPSTATRIWAEKQAASHSLSSASVERRVIRSVLNDLPMPQFRGLEKPAADAQAEDLARRYAIYKLGFLQKWAHDTVDAPRLCELAVRQNYLVG